MKSTKPQLVAVDGIDAAAVLAAAHAAIGSPPRGGISRWDASGVFQDLSVAEEAAGAPSARVLLLLYATDLAFRLRWEIRPALAEGRTVVAAPYIDTALAFGRAAGVPVAWLINLLRFAPRPSDQRFVHPAGGRALAAAGGFVAFSCERMGGANGLTPRQIIERTAANLRGAERRYMGRTRSVRGR